MIARRPTREGRHYSTVELRHESTHAGAMMMGRRCLLCMLLGLWVLLAVLSATSIFLATSSRLTESTASRPSTSGDVTEADVNRISELLALAKAGKYAGTDRTRPGRINPDRTRPVWSQRTALLYYHRRQAGAAVMWMCLALGTVGNARNVISNKKAWMGVWEEASPAQFEKMKDYLPRTWIDVDSFKVSVNSCSCTHALIATSCARGSHRFDLWLRVR